MTAVTADQTSITRARAQIVEDIFPIKTSVTLYVGALANFVTATGRVRSAAAETGSGLEIAGEVVEIINESGSVISAGTGNAGGTVKARIQWGHLMLLNVRTAIRTFTNLGKTVFVSDNVTVGGTAVGTAATRVQAGQLTAFANSSGQPGVSDKTMAYVKLRDCTGALIAV
jgi:hypothetical protein